MNYTIICQYGPHPAMVHLFPFDNGYIAEKVYQRMCQGIPECTIILMFKAVVLSAFMGEKGWKVNCTLGDNKVIFAE